MTLLEKRDQIMRDLIAAMSNWRMSVMIPPNLVQRHKTAKCPHCKHQGAKEFTVARDLLIGE